MSDAVEFAVWAPIPKRVRLQVDGTVHDMHREDAEEGRHRALLGGFLGALGGLLGRLRCGLVLGVLIVTGRRRQKRARERVAEQRAQQFGR